MGEESRDLPPAVVGGSISSEPSGRPESAEEGGASVESLIGAIGPGPTSYPVEESISNNVLHLNSVGGAGPRLTPRPAVGWVRAAVAGTAAAHVGGAAAVLGGSPVSGEK